METKGLVNNGKNQNAMWLGGDRGRRREKRPGGINIGGGNIGGGINIGEKTGCGIHHNGRTVHCRRTKGRIAMGR